MKKYKLMVIITPDLAEDKVGVYTDSLKELLSSAKIKVTQTDDWGVRDLAYPIRVKTIQKTFKKGRYLLLKVETSAMNIEKISPKLKLKEDVIRHMFSIDLDHTSGKGKRTQDTSLKL